jgi:hypothetical protein
MMWKTMLKMEANKWFESFILFKMLPISINAPIVELYCSCSPNERSGIIGGKEIVIDAQIS